MLCGIFKGCIIKKEEVFRKAGFRLVAQHVMVYKTALR